MFISYLFMFFLKHHLMIDYFLQSSILTIWQLHETGWMFTYMTILWREICRQLQRPSKQKERSLQIQLVCICLQVVWSNFFYLSSCPFSLLSAKTIIYFLKTCVFSAIDAPGGFLFEWWSVFWDIFIARTNEKHSDVAASYIEVSTCACSCPFCDQILFNVYRLIYLLLFVRPSTKSKLFCVCKVHLRCVCTTGSPPPTQGKKLVELLFLLFEFPLFLMG